MWKFACALVCLLILPEPSHAAPPDAWEQGAVGMHSFVMTDRTRVDPLGHAREWRVDLYYSATDAGHAAPPAYASNPTLVDRLVRNGYYDVPEQQLRAWQKKSGPAVADLPVANPETPKPLVAIAPGSGVTAFNYSELAASFVRRGYVVALIDLPYVGISQLPDGRFLDPNDDPVQRTDDPKSWRPRVREWSTDVSRVLDQLLSPRSRYLPRRLKIDPRRLVITGHSFGGTVALQVCHDDRRVEGCGDFEGSPMASDTFDQGSIKPLFVTAARSAKSDRPFRAPDLSNPFWSYLRLDGPSTWAIGITRASHMSYSDAPFEMPQTLSRFGGELMTPERSFEVYVGLVDAFARAYAPGGSGDRGFQRFLESTPEVLSSQVGGR